MKRAKTEKAFPKRFSRSKNHKRTREITSIQNALYAKRKNSKFSLQTKIPTA